MKIFMSNESSLLSEKFKEENREGELRGWGGQTTSKGQKGAVFKTSLLKNYETFFSSCEFVRYLFPENKVLEIRNIYL